METENAVLRNVENLLNKYPDLRNNDLELDKAYWIEYDEAIVTLKSKKPLTMPTTIERKRQLLQAAGKYLPTDPKVCRRRGKKPPH